MRSPKEAIFRQLYLVGRSDLHNHPYCSADRISGQISASLTSFARTVDDYNKLAKQELVPDKQTKAFERVKTFRSDQADYRERFDRLKAEADQRVRGQS